MEQFGVLQRALDLLCPAGNHFCLVIGNDLLETGLAMLQFIDALKKIGDVADAMVQTLTTVCTALAIWSLFEIRH
jgi:hypothetical protein